MKKQSLDLKWRLVKLRKAVREALGWDRRHLWILQPTSIRLVTWPIKWSVGWAMFLVKDWEVWVANSEGHPLGSKKLFQLTRFKKIWKEMEGQCHWAASYYHSWSLFIPIPPTTLLLTCQHLSLIHSIVGHLNDQTRCIIWSRNARVTSLFYIKERLRQSFSCRVASHAESAFWCVCGFPAYISRGYT